MRASVLTVKKNLPDDLEESDYSVRVRQGVVSVHIQTKSFLQRGSCFKSFFFFQHGCCSYTKLQLLVKYINLYGARLTKRI